MSEYKDIEEHLARRKEDKEVFREAVKEAITEWLDKQFMTFGKWSAIGISAALFALLAKLLIAENIIPR